MWSSPFLKGLFIALLSLPFVLSVFLPPPASDIPDLTLCANPLPKHPVAITRSGSDCFWLSDTELAFRDDTKRGVYLNIWNWRTGKVTSLPGYSPPANSLHQYIWLTPSPDGHYLLFTGREALPNKRIQQRLYILDLRSDPKKPGFLRTVPVENGHQSKWFQDSRRYIYNRFTWSGPNAFFRLRIQVRDVSQPGKMTEVPLQETHSRDEGAVVLGITPDGDTVHFFGNNKRSDGEGRILHTPLESAARPVKEYSVTPPRGMATVRFEPIYNTSLARNKKGEDQLLWVEQRVANPLERIAYQMNFLPYRLLPGWLRYSQPAYYFVLWVSKADGTNFRPVGRTPRGTYISNEQWLPGGNQVAVRLYRYDARGRLTERFYFCSVE